GLPATQHLPSLAARGPSGRGRAVVDGRRQDEPEQRGGLDVPGFAVHRVLPSYRRRDIAAPRGAQRQGRCGEQSREREPHQSTSTCSTSKQIGCPFWTSQLYMLVPNPLPSTTQALPWTDRK